MSTTVPLQALRSVAATAAPEPSADGVPVPILPASEPSLRALPQEARRSLVGQAEQQAAAAALLQELEALHAAVSAQHREVLLHKASAEHARRTAVCLRACLESLLSAIAQPGFALDREARVICWNAALEEQTGVPAIEVLGSEAEDVLMPASGSALRDAVRSLAEPDPDGAPQGLSLLRPMTFRTGRAHRIALIPQFRIPGCVEAALCLLTPCLACDLNEADRELLG